MMLCDMIFSMTMVVAYPEPQTSCRLCLYNLCRRLPQACMHAHFSNTIAARSHQLERSLLHMNQLVKSTVKARQS